MGCRSSVDSLSGLTLGGGEVESVESLEMFSRGDSAAPDLLSALAEVSSLVCGELRGPIASARQL